MGLKMTKAKFNKIRSRLEMRLMNQGFYNPKNDMERFVVYIIEMKHALDKKVENFEEK